MNIKRFRTVTAILTIAVMAFIFIMSAQNASESSAVSDPITRFICERFFDFSDMSQQQIEAFMGNMSFWVRKAAHFLIYFVLGLCVFCTVVTVKRLNFYLRACLSFVVCALYAVSDEFHQLFVVGRSCEFRDMCIDSAGALLSILLLLLAVRFSKKFKGVR